MAQFTPEQEKLIYTAVRRYQIERTTVRSEEYNKCTEILNLLFETVYTQQQEQPT